MHDVKYYLYNLDYIDNGFSILSVIEYDIHIQHE